MSGGSLIAEWRGPVVMSGATACGVVGSSQSGEDRKHPFAGFGYRPVGHAGGHGR
jgi:hypothetical protein